MFLADWLHCVDIGAAADFLGELFWMLLGKLPGNNQEEQCMPLWLRKSCTTIRTTPVTAATTT